MQITAHNAVPPLSTLGIGLSFASIESDLVVLAPRHGALDVFDHANAAGIVPPLAHAVVDRALFSSQLLPLMPRLRSYALSLAHHHDRADDLVQETLFKALRHREKFAAGSNLIGWLTTILRNEYYTMLRKRREVEDVDEMFSSRLSVPEGQIHYLELLETMSNIRSLPTGQRMAVILVAALGYTCHEAADQCATKVGTIKSRLNRGRATLRHGVAHGETSRRDGWNGSPSVALTAIATDRDVRLE